MKYIVLFIVSAVGCSDPLPTITVECPPTPAIKVDFPGTTHLMSAIGPLVVNPAKWGTDSQLPFAWPSRVSQIDPTNPSDPRDQLVYEAKIPVGSALSLVQTWVSPRVGHAGIPANRAATAVWVHDNDMQTEDVLGTDVTFGDSVASYEQRRLLSVELAQPLEILPEMRVLIYVSGEAGNGFLPGLVVDTPRVTYIVP